VKNQIHYGVFEGHCAVDFLEWFRDALKTFASADPVSVDTSILIAPNCLADFLEFNDFLSLAERLLRQLRLAQDIQIASFHPRYCFAQTDADDITNFTNRAPFPTLHLLRETSVARAVQAFPDAQAIFGANQRQLILLGIDGWNDLLLPAQYK
jgi:hypothetical protein